MAAETVAIVGVAVDVPGGRGLAEFRASLAAGKDAVRPLSPERIRTSNLDPTGDYPALSHFDRIDLFDYEFFGLSRREAEVMDPQHRQTLQLAYHAVQDAGYTRDHLAERSTAVVLSSPRADYARLIEHPDTLSLLGNVPSALSGRVAHLLGLTGPCYGVDTGCNASLVAVHHACRELLSGEADCALAGGFSLKVLHEPRAVRAAFPEIMSADARCRAFDADADGTGDGEGGAVLLLTTLSRARREGRRVYATIDGTAISHNGAATATMSAPNAAAQAQTIRRAWQHAGLDLADAGYVETHGAGTRLGDAVEVEGLAAARTSPAGALAIGSVKTNIGHLDHAAGIVGLVKAMLSVYHGELYPSLHFTRPAPGVDLTAAGLEVVTSRRPWRTAPGVPRRAGVSSFSLTGVNAHCVLSQPPTPDHPASVPRRSAEPRLVGVSAHSPAALSELCADLAAALRSGDYDLDEVVRALGEGREHHPVRLGFLARGTGDLADQLAAAAAGLRLAGPAPAQRPGPGRAAGQAGTRLYFLLSRDASQPDGSPPGGPFPPSQAGHIVGWQIAHADRLSRLGLTPDGVLSSGTSRHPARFLEGRCSRAAVDAGVAATSGPHGDGLGPPADRDRLRTVVTELTGDGPAIFVELGTGGELSSAVVDLLPANATLLCVDGVDSDATVRTAARLYEAGATVDWTAGRPADAPLPVMRSLPTYPFQGRPCWVLPEEHPMPWSRLWPATNGAGGATGATDRHPTPRSTVRDTLRALWSRVLHENGIGDEDNYFDLGGNSITALQVIHGVHTEFGVRLKTVDLYDHATLGELAAFVDRIVADAPSAPAPSPHAGALRTFPDPGPAPESTHRAPADLTITAGAPSVPSFGQERLWFHHQLDPDSPLYNIPTRMHLHGRLNREAFCGAVDDLITRHDVLRARFPDEDSRPGLVIAERLDEVVRFIDVSDRPDPDTQARHLVEEEAAVPFDLVTGPLVRGLLVMVREDEHLYCLTVHHAVDDGWSPGIVVDELREFYTARLRHRAPRLDPLPVQYHDYARWQRQLHDSGALDAELEYWRRTLADPPVLDLPTDRRRPAKKDYRGGVVHFTVPADLARSLRRLGREESATLFTVLYTAVSVFLARCSGQDDIVVGTPTAGRSRPETWPLIGFFNNTVALRLDCGRQPPFRRLVRRARSVVLDAMDHQEVPFERVVGAVAPPRDLSRHPLFDVMIVHQTLTAIDGTFPDLTVSSLDAGGQSIVHNGLAPGTAKFDLTVCFWDREDHEDLPVGVEYSAQLFDRETTASLASAFQTLLWSIAADADQPIDELPLVMDNAAELFATPAEPARHPTADRAVSNPPDVPKQTGLHCLIINQARRTPTAVAVETATLRLRYQDLTRWSAAVAATLTDAGVEPGCTVAVALQRSPDQIACALGVLRAGCTYLPLDPNQPATRLAGLVADCGAAAVLTGPGARLHLPDAVTVLDSPACPAADELALPEPLNRVDPDQIAYVIYTSGSTGRPRGVEVTHTSAAHLIQVATEVFGFDQNTRMLQFTAPTFDGWLVEVCTTLSAGGMVFVPSASTVLVGSVLAEEIDRHRVTATLLPPSVLATVPPQSHLPTVELLIVGGEACSPDLVRRWARGRRMLNAYGPTETTVMATVEECRPGGARPAIGRLLPGYRGWVVDSAGRPVPPGFRGELVIGGVGLARGYRGRPELTAQRFGTLDMLGLPDTRGYRTGDLVRRLPDDRLDYLGRTDTQVKHRGYRIELGEVEHALRGCPGVSDAAAALRGRRPDQILVGFVTADGTVAVEGEAAREHVAGLLPGYMVPTVVGVVPALPINRHGKLDRGKLPDVDTTTVSAVASTDRPPGDELERTISEAIACAVGRRRVDPDDGFFELGGHSLIAVRLIADINGLLGTNLPVSVLFEHPTATGLARCVRNGAATHRCLVPLRGEGDESPLFCVHPSGGNVLVYRDLTAALNPSRPVLAVQSWGLGAGCEPDRRIERMADRYLAEILDAYPEGPHHLVGWSLGGAVTLELAHRLHCDGRPMGLVGLIDVDLDQIPRTPELSDSQLLVDLLAPLAPPEAAVSLRAATEQPVGEVLRVGHELGVLPESTGFAEITRLLAVLRANDAAFTDWLPPPYPGPVLLLRAKDGRVTDAAVRRMRIHLPGPLTVREVPGDHFSVISTHATLLAKELHQALQTGEEFDQTS
ncbi:MAG: amino acid adenylation domain-containing protein [Pseudonocardiaceae bacterium]